MKRETIVYVDGQPTSVPEELSGTELNRLAQCRPGHFTVIDRNTADIPELLSVPRDQRQVRLQNGDRIVVQPQIIPGN
jgi:hypothetical protein